VRIVVDAAELAVVGITEVISKLPEILRGIGVFRRLLKGLRPDLLILIDFPDFNLLMASIAKKLDIPVLYYISPQIWAWRQGRARRIARVVDHMAVILPFEEKFYQGFNVPVSFVGHPLLDTHLPPAGNALKSGLQNPPVIGLVPGSRDTEITRLLPIMLEAGGILKRKLKGVDFIVSRADSVKITLIESVLGQQTGWKEIEIVSGGVEQVFERSDVIIAASGTVTLQAAIHGTPMVITYKVSPVSAWLGKAFIQVDHVGLVNLVADRTLVPELLQDAATGSNIAQAVLDMIENKPKLDQLRSELIALRDTLGGTGASKRVAELALGMLGSQ
jgi:lipid-A-disaccharide synthase